MAQKTYCCCYNLDTGATFIGFFHLNAALYFWARVFTFEPIYMWIDILIAACYTLRTTWFFLSYYNDFEESTKRQYFEMNKWTTFGLTLTGLLIIMLKWIEWSHIPTW